MNIKTILAVTAIISAAVGCGGGRQQKSAADQTAVTFSDLDSLEIKYAPVLKAGDTAPEFSAPDTLGQTVSLSDFKGSYVVVDFWATWCPDCRHELPDLKAVYSQYKDASVAGYPVRFLSVSFDRNADAWKKMIREEGMEWAQCGDIGAKWKESPITAAYSLGWIPTFYLISPEGKVLAGSIKASRMGEALGQL